MQTYNKAIKDNILEFFTDSDNLETPDLSDSEYNKLMVEGVNFINELKDLENTHPMSSIKSILESSNKYPNCRITIYE